MCHLERLTNGHFGDVIFSEIKGYRPCRVGEHRLRQLKALSGTANTLRVFKLGDFALYSHRIPLFVGIEDVQDGYWFFVVLRKVRKLEGILRGLWCANEGHVVHHDLIAILRVGIVYQLYRGSGILALLQ